MSTLTKSDIEEYYEGTGYNIDDTAKYLMGNAKSGYTLSYDRSLLVVSFKGFTVVCGVDGLQFIETKQG